jgi:hypothetical protein
VASLVKVINTFEHATGIAENVTIDIWRARRERATFLNR